MMRPPNLSLLSEAPSTATERGCRMRSGPSRGVARSASREAWSTGSLIVNAPR